jgi:hypothetical protein
MNALWVSNTLAGKVTYRAFCEPRSLRRPLPLPPRAAVAVDSVDELGLTRSAIGTSVVVRHSGVVGALVSAADGGYTRCDAVRLGGPSRSWRRTAFVRDFIVCRAILGERFSAGEVTTQRGRSGLECGSKLRGRIWYRIGRR